MSQKPNEGEALEPTVYNSRQNLTSSINRVPARGWGKRPAGDGIKKANDVQTGLQHWRLFTGIPEHNVGDSCARPEMWLSSLHSLLPAGIRAAR